MFKYIVLYIISIDCSLFHFEKFYIYILILHINFIADELKSEGIVISALNYEQNKECCQKLGVIGCGNIYM